MQGYNFQRNMSPSYPSQYGYDMSWNANQGYGGMDQQVPFSNFANSSQQFIQEHNPQAYTSQWCSHCGGDHFEESCYLFHPTNHVPQNFFPQDTYNYQIPYQDPTNYQYQEHQYQDLSQNYQPLDPIVQNQHPPPLTLEAMMDKLQKSLQQGEEEIRQNKEKLRQEAERLEQLSAHYKMLEEQRANEKLQEQLFPNKDEDLEDEYNKDFDKCIETENLSGEYKEDMQVNGDEEQLYVVQDSPLPFENLEDEELKEHHVIEDSNLRKDYMPETQIELQENNDSEQLEDSQLDKVLNEITQNPIGVEEDDGRVVWKRCFEEKNYQKGSLEEESIFLDIEPRILPEWNMQELSLKEFFDARHLRIYLEGKVDGEKGLVSTQSVEECDSRGCVELIDVKLSASWEAPHVILYFLAF